MSEEIEPEEEIEAEESSAFIGRLRMLAILGTVCVLLPTILGTLFGTSHTFELMTHFKAYYAIVAFLMIFVAIFTGARKATVVLFACLVFHLVGIAPWYFSESMPDPVPEKNLRLMAANLLRSNKDHSRFIEYVRQSKPDIVIVQEVDAAWRQSLEKLRPEYPYMFFKERSDNFGIGMISRFPFETASIGYYGAVPSAVATVKIHDRTVRIFGMHPVPPVSSRCFKDRNKLLEELGEHISTRKGLVIAAGDINATMWSPYYKKFVEKTGLKNTRKGYGIIPTWKSSIPLVNLPIDHCFVSKEIIVTDFYSGEDIGSDHLPIIAELYIPGK